MKLIIATYNHQNKKNLEREDSLRDPATFRIAKSKNTLRDEARDTAVRLLGAPASLYANISDDILPDNPAKNIFTFIGAFPYISNSIPDDGSTEAEEARTNNLFGWVAIVSDNDLGALKTRMGWPNSPFCQAFDIMISDINPSASDGKITEVEDALQNKNRPDDLWVKNGLEVYEEHTPTSWSP